MAQLPVFGKKEALRITLLGFTIYKDRGKGGHFVAKHPIRKPDPIRQIANVTIPRYKTYHDPQLRKNFINEIMAFGFTKDQVLTALKGKRPKGI